MEFDLTLEELDKIMSGVCQEEGNFPSKLQRLLGMLKKGKWVIKQAPLETQVSSRELSEKPPNRTFISRNDLVSNSFQEIASVLKGRDHPEFAKESLIAQLIYYFTCNSQTAFLSQADLTKIITSIGNGNYLEALYQNELKKRSLTVKETQRLKDEAGFTDDGFKLLKKKLPIELFPSQAEMDRNLSFLFRDFSWIMQPRPTSDGYCLNVLNLTEMVKFAHPEITEKQDSIAVNLDSTTTGGKSMVGGSLRYINSSIKQNKLLSRKYDYRFIMFFGDESKEMVSENVFEANYEGFFFLFLSFYILFSFSSSFFIISFFFNFFSFLFFFFIYFFIRLFLRVFWSHFRERG